MLKNECSSKQANSIHVEKSRRHANNTVGMAGGQVRYKQSKVKTKISVPDHPPDTSCVFNVCKTIRTKNNCSTTAATREKKGIILCGLAKRCSCIQARPRWIVPRLQVKLTVRCALVISSESTNINFYTDMKIFLYKLTPETVVGGAKWAEMETNAEPMNTEQQPKCRLHHGRALGGDGV